MHNLWSLDVEVADLRSTPTNIPCTDYSHQDERLSQCNYGDLIQLLHRKDDYCFVSVVEQLQYKERKWQGYRGWLHISEIKPAKKMGMFSRKPIPHWESFLGLPYLWGGCSVPISGKIASVDCSGLVYQLCKKQGRVLPRDAHDQYLAAKPVRIPLPGDLLFLRPLFAKRVSHVLLLVTPDLFLEAPETGKTVRLLKKEKEIWYKNHLFTIFDRTKSYQGSFGRLV